VWGGCGRRRARGVWTEDGKRERERERVVCNEGSGDTEDVLLESYIVDACDVIAATMDTQIIVQNSRTVTIRPWK
jgi:hypothetical protein